MSFETQSSSAIIYFTICFEEIVANVKGRRYLILVYSSPHLQKLINYS
jgi:hypothetical protein